MTTSRTLNSAWYHALYEVQSFGRPVAPRGQDTLELPSHQMHVDMGWPIVTNPARMKKSSFKFMAAEAAWILEGDDRVETIAPFSQHIAQFSDDGERFFGAYGPRIMAQKEYAIYNLRRDRDSRQAYINIWRENPPATKDVPCTLGHLFMIRDGLLEVHTVMRSNDLWLGTPLDVFGVSMLAAYVLLEAKIPGIGLGSIYHTAFSRHLYARDFDKALETRKYRFSCPMYQPFHWQDFTSGQELVDHLWAFAHGRQLHRPFLQEFV